MQNKKIPWGEIGYITFKRTYARKLSENSNKTEEFEDQENPIGFGYFGYYADWVINELQQGV